ncbi:MAG: TIGR04076 family protein [Deltaproteobacteria bacterium]|nr:TIGR04076 family protein [Deltaproteobacteria bacterium]
MANQHDIRIKVLSQEGACAAGHKVGDEWIITGKTMPAGLCPVAFNACFPHVRVLQRGGGYPWLNHKEAGRTICTDPENTVAFEIRRIVK